MLALLVCAMGLYAVVYAVAGASWFTMSEKDLSRVEGCYSVAGQQLFKISGRTLFTPGGPIGFEGSHEKDRDVLVMDGPMRLVRRPRLMLVREGTLTKVPISHEGPVRLELWDENDHRVEASRTECSVVN